jgi:hypothetical protein
MRRMENSPERANVQAKVWECGGNPDLSGDTAFWADEPPYLKQAFHPLRPVK